MGKARKRRITCARMRVRPSWSVVTISKIITGCPGNPTKAIVPSPLLLHIDSGQTVRERLFSLTCWVVEILVLTLLRCTITTADKVLISIPASFKVSNGISLMPTMLILETVGVLNSRALFW